MHVSVFGGTRLSLWLLRTKKALPQNWMWSSEWQTVNNQYPLPSGLLRLLNLFPVFPQSRPLSPLSVRVAWSVWCLWLMHLEQLLRVLVCRDTSFTADVGLHVGRTWWMVLHLQMQVHRTEVDLFSGPYVKGGWSAPSRTRYSYLVNLQRAERLRGSARMAVDYLLVIVTHSCRSYLPITSIASHILGTNKGRFPPIIPQRDRIHQLTAQTDQEKKKRRMHWVHAPRGHSSF